MELINTAHFKPRQRPPRARKPKAVKEVYPKEITPRFEYDCGHCKLNWNCGDLCACFKWQGAIPTPKDRAYRVARFQRYWRKLTQIEDIKKRDERIDALKARIRQHRKDWYAANPQFPIPPITDENS